MKKLLWSFILLVSSFLPAGHSCAEAIPLIDQFTLTSSAFSDGGDIPELYTCKGADTNPPLEIHNVPEKARSLLLIVREPENPIGPWTHWLVYNIRPGIHGIPENSVPGTQALNDFGNFYYGGPCVFDAARHNFLFTVYALDSYLDDVNEGSTFETIEKAMKDKVIGKAQIVGMYQNPLWGQDEKSL
jgi:Raf kinase inhibitor-like YbhB/YbcL family protein